MADGRFSDPDGNEFQRDVVHHPGAVSVVPLLDSGEVVLVRQYRAALDATVLEIPAGKLDVPGEEPEEAAQRELAEEVGYRAGRLDELAQFWNSPGFCDEHSTVYLGRDLAATDRAVQGVEEAHMTMESVALDAIPAMIAAHQLLDAKTIIGCTLALRALEGPAH